MTGSTRSTPLLDNLGKEQLCRPEYQLRDTETGDLLLCYVANEYGYAWDGIRCDGCKELISSKPYYHLTECINHVVQTLDEVFTHQCPECFPKFLKQESCDRCTQYFTENNFFSDFERQSTLVYHLQSQSCGDGSLTENASSEPIDTVRKKTINK